MQIVLGPAPFTIFKTDASAYAYATKAQDNDEDGWTYRAVKQPGGDRYLVAAHDDAGEFVAFVEALA